MDAFGLVITDWLLLVLFAIGLSVYWYSTSTFGIFKNAGIKGPVPVPFFGTMRHLRKVGYGAFDMKTMSKYGKLVGTYQGKLPVLLIADPEHIKQVFVKDIQTFTNQFVLDLGNPLFSKSLSNLKGDDWKRVRSILTPTFSSGKMRKMMDLLNKSLGAFIEHLETIAETKTSFEGKQEFGKLAIDLIASALFGLEVDAITDADSPFVRHISSAFGAGGVKNKLVLVLAFYAPYLLPVLRHFGFSFAPAHVIEFFRKTTEQVLDQRRKGGAQYNDFMALVLKAHTDDDIDKEDLERQKQLENNFNTRGKKGLTDEEIQAQALMFYFAGYETTASLMSYMAYCLATNPHCQETLYRETLDALGSDHHELTYDQLQSMQYLDQVMWETLRLHSPVLRFDRISSRPFEIGGHKLPANVDVQVPIYYLHHCEEYWKEPLKFDPTRFSPEEKAKRNPYVYCPFGQGPRNCIGMRFAIMEAKAAICQVVRNFRIELAPGMEPNLDPCNPKQKWKSVGFNYPVDGIKLQLERRN